MKCRKFGCSRCVAEAIKRADMARMRELLSQPVAFQDVVWLPGIGPAPATLSRYLSAPAPAASAPGTSGLRLDHYDLEHPNSGTSTELYRESLIRLALADPATDCLQILIESNRFDLNRPFRFHDFDRDYYKNNISRFSHLENAVTHYENMYSLYVTPNDFFTLKLEAVLEDPPECKPFSKYLTAKTPIEFCTVNNILMLKNMLLPDPP